MKRKSSWFFLLAGVLSHMMCAVVAYNYCNLRWVIRYQCYAAPAEIAFLLVIPYLFGIAVCIGAALFFRRRENAP